MKSLRKFFSNSVSKEEKRKEFKFTKYEIEPAVFFVNEIQAEIGTYLYEKVFKLKKKTKKRRKQKAC